MPKEAKEKVEKEIKRLESIPAMSPEHSYIRTYIEWMLDVPWTEKTKDVLDIIKAKKILDEDHYDLERVKVHILDYLAVRKLKGQDYKRSNTLLCRSSRSRKDFTGTVYCQGYGKEIYKDVYWRYQG